MDILNWLYIKTQGLVRREANDAKTDLIALGANVGFNKRDDQYQTYAMPLTDGVQSGIAGNTGYYTVDFTTTNIVDVTTPRGVIEIALDSGDTNPLPAFGSAITLVITNSGINFTNPDNIYQQITPYYNPSVDDTFIPYVVTTGFLAGSNIAILNANPNPAGVDQFKGKFYIYYELYNF